MRQVTLAFLLLTVSGASMASETSVYQGNHTFTLAPAHQSSMSIQVGKTYVTIKPDGTIVYGEGYTPDAAAKAFWDAVGLERKERK